MSFPPAGSAGIVARTTATPELVAPHYPTGGITAAADGMRRRAVAAALAPWRQAIADARQAAARAADPNTRHRPPRPSRWRPTPQARPGTLPAKLHAPEAAPMAHDAGAPKLHAPFPPAGPTAAAPTPAPDPHRGAHAAPARCAHATSPTEPHAPDRACITRDTSAPEAHAPFPPADATAQPTRLAQTPVQTPRTGNARTRTQARTPCARPCPHRTRHQRTRSPCTSLRHRSNQTFQHAMPYTVRMARAAHRQATVVPCPSVCARPAGAMPANSRTSDAMPCNVSRPPNPPGLAHHPTRARRRLIQLHPLAVGTGRPGARPFRSPARANHHQPTHRRRPGRKSRHAMPSTVRNRAVAKPGTAARNAIHREDSASAPHQGEGGHSDEGRKARRRCPGPPTFARLPAGAG